MRESSAPAIERPVAYVPTNSVRPYSIQTFNGVNGELRLRSTSVIVTTASAPIYPPWPHYKIQLANDEDATLVLDRVEAVLPRLWAKNAS